MRSPLVVPQVDCAPAVKVNAPPEVKLEAEVGVRLTAPAPLAVKSPAVKVKAILLEAEVVMVAPPV